MLVLGWVLKGNQEEITQNRGCSYVKTRPSCMLAQFCELGLRSLQRSQLFLLFSLFPFDLPAAHLSIASCSWILAPCVLSHFKLQVGSGLLAYDKDAPFNPAGKALHEVGSETCTAANCSCVSTRVTTSSKSRCSSSSLLQIAATSLCGYGRPAVRLTGMPGCIFFSW